MESIVFLDTHVVIWLYSGQLDLFNPRALKLINEKQLCISHITRLEIMYLKEIGRVKVDPSVIIDSLVNEIGLTFSENRIERIVTQAIYLNFTGDPFDRIIVADASINNSIIISKDENIKKHYKNTFW